MLKRLNGFKMFYLFSLIFLVIELLLVVFGLSFIPILCSLLFDSLFFVLFCHILTNFYKKSGAESVHAFSFIFSFIFTLFFWGFLCLSFSDNENTMIPPIYHSAEIQGNYVEIPHGVIPIRSRDYYELVNPFIMKINAKYSDEGY